MERESSTPADDGRPPRYCPVCEQDLSDHPYYQVLPGALARRLQGVAGYFIPLMGIVFVVQLFTGAFPLNYSGVSGYFILAYICTPSLLVYAATLVMPKVRRAICLHCSWYHDYPFHLGPFEAQPQEPPGGSGSSGEEAFTPAEA